MTTTVKGLNLSFGLLSVVGDVLNVKRPNAAKDEQFKKICPLHPGDPHLVSQRYVCADGLADDVLLPSECLKGRPVEDGFKIVSQDDISKAKESEIPKKTLDLAAHPYDPTTTFASGQAFVFRPEAANQFYSALLLLVNEQGVVETETGDKMLVGLTSFRSGSEAFVRLERWGSQLVLRELIRPEDVDSFESIDGTVETKVIDMARQVIEAQSEEFDPSAYRSRVRERIAALVEAEGEGVQPLTTARPKEDTMALLEATLAEAKARKATQ